MVWNVLCFCSHSSGNGGIITGILVGIMIVVIVTAVAVVIILAAYVQYKKKTGSYSFRERSRNYSINSMCSTETDKSRVYINVSAAATPQVTIYFTRQIIRGGKLSWFLLTTNVLPLKFFLEYWHHPLITQSMVPPGLKFSTVKVFPTY